MWESVGGVFKELAEKHLIPVAIAIVGGIGALLYFPSDYWMIEKVGKWMFFIFVAGIIFLAIKFLILICAKFRDAIETHSMNIEYREKNKQEMQQDMYRLWREVDAMSPDDRKLLKEFIRSGNKPIDSIGMRAHGSNCLLHSTWMVSTVVHGEPTKESLDSVYAQFGESLSKETAYKLARPIFERYKLADDIYNILKYSMDTYGKISNFE